MVNDLFNVEVAETADGLRKPSPVTAPQKESERDAEASCERERER